MTNPDRTTLERYDEQRYLRVEGGEAEGHGRKLAGFCGEGDVEGHGKELGLLDEEEDTEGHGNSRVQVLG